MNKSSALNIAQGPACYHENTTGLDDINGWDFREEQPCLQAIKIFLASSAEWFDIDLRRIEIRDGGN